VTLERKVEPTTTSQQGETSRAFVDVLVAQALDDLQQTRFAVRVAIRRVAQLAWEEGRRQGIRECDAPEPDDTEGPARAAD
jgi:hypothetical protein